MESVFPANGLNLTNTTLRPQQGFESGLVRQTIVEHDVEHVPRDFRKAGDFVREIGPIGHRRDGRLAICAMGFGGGSGWGYGVYGVHNWMMG